MPTIAEIREQYPQYKDLSDQQLTDALYKKYYSDIPRDQFDRKMAGPSTTWDVVKSLGRGAAKFAIEDVAGPMIEAASNVNPAGGAIAAVMGARMPGDVSEKASTAIEDLYGGLGEAETPGGKFAESGLRTALGFVVPEEGLANITRRGLSAIKPEPFMSRAAWRGPANLKPDSTSRALEMAGMTKPAAKETRDIIKNTAGRLATGAAAGVGAEAAGEISDDNPLARLAGGALVGGAGGVRTMLKARQGRADALKAAEEVKKAAQEGYKILDEDRVAFDPLTDLNLFGTSILTAIERDGGDRSTAPATFRIVRNGLINRNFKDVAGGPTVSSVINIYQKLNDIQPTPHPSDYKRAQDAKEMIRTWLQSHNFGEVHNKALANWASGAKAQELEKAKSVAEHRAAVSGTGTNEENTYRQEIRKILDNDKRVRGYTPEERQQMEDFLTGGTLRNWLRYAERLDPRRGGAAVTELIGSMYNAPLAAGMAVTGIGAKTLGQWLTKKQFEDLVHNVLARAPANEWVESRQQTKIGRARISAASSFGRGAAFSGARPQPQDPESVSDAIANAPP